ncbi:MAG: hypothetical protein ACM3SX_01135 [Deltaproteobacteria bacterium]|nr:hypothetical protein [Acidimicrobiia bacterium]
MRRLRYALTVASALAVAVRGDAQVQRADSSRRAPAAAVATPNDSLRPPLSPRRAFFYSFLAPGYSQSVLGRHKAATSFVLVEAITVAMIRESAADLHEARRMANDTVVVSYVDASGNPSVVALPPRFGDADVHTRAAHVEDWIALLVANHLFAGADAYVAANLWDVPARLGLRMLPHGAVLSASIKW